MPTELPRRGLAGGNVLKTLLWTVTAGLALLWSLGVWLVVQFFDVLLGLWPTNGLPTTLPAEVAWPAWVELWWPREQLDALLLLARDVASWLAASIPSVETWQSLLGIGMWVVWGSGLLVLLALALGGQFWLSRTGTARVVRV